MIRDRPRPALGPAPAIRICGLFLLSCLPQTSEPLDLTPGSRQDRALPDSRGHLYDFQLDVDDYLDLAVHQKGVDVLVTVIGPKGTLFEVDSPTRAQGQETVVLVARTKGIHRLRVESETPGRGTYAIEVRATGPAGDAEHARAAAAQDFYRGDDLRRAKDFDQALSHYERALIIWKQLDDRAWMAESYDRIGLCRRELGRQNPQSRHAAIEAFHQAVKRFRQVGDELREGLALDQLGAVHFESGETELATRYSELALRIWQRRRDALAEAETRGNLAKFYRVLGRVQEAQDNYTEALEIFTERAALGSGHGERNVAHMLHDLGTLFRSLGEWQRAESYLRQAEGKWPESDQISLATTLNQLGQLYFDTGNLDQALELFRDALELRRQAGRPNGEASTLSRIGRIERDLGRLAEALESCRQAVSILEPLENHRTLANARRCLGSVYQQIDDHAAANDAWERALESYREIRDALGQAATWGEIATARHDWGHLEAGLEAVQNALEIAETIRGRPRGTNLRLAYFATAQPIFSRGVEILTDLGRGGRAFELNERSRARSLIDLLSRPGAGSDPSLSRRRRQLEHRIANTYARLMDLGESSSEPAKRLEEELIEHLAALDEVRGLISAAEPSPPPSLSLTEVQGLLGPDAVLLALRLGEERSHLWLVTPERFDAIELPDRERIEELAQPAYKALSESFDTGRRRAAEIHLCNLSREILGPIGRSPAAGTLSEGRHLLIAPDGVLQRIPFAALPDPSADDCLAPGVAQLIDRHVISYLPSASVLAELRRGDRARSTAQGLIAVLADPAFQPRRSQTAGSRAPDSRAPATSQSWERLPGTRAEAEDILALLPRGQRSFVALDFDATKEIVTGGDLADYRILHFATHGQTDDRFPELSHLALSRFDEHGQRLDGDLRALEIHGLQLPAELVVLSACETALGRDVAGEGLVGLTRAFFSAGAARVMVSLWRVGDRNTRALMSAFYTQLLRHGVSPPVALREAQLALRRQETLASPYAWAGWVIQGEWRPFSFEATLH